MIDLPRPVVHFTPPNGWMNDPNGLVFHDGEYHLFYQHHPHSLVWGPMHWGHAVSQDLVTWEPLPVALAPDSLGTIFSGSAVWDGENSTGLVPGGGLIAVFSYDSQAQGLASSTDQGRTWTKYAGNPVIPALSRDFRDPKVFPWGDRWAAVLAVGDHVEFFQSSNLREWTVTGRFAANLGMGVWECPDLFPLPVPGGERWVLVLSVGDLAINGGSGTLYWVGDFDGASFVPESGPLWLDGGTDCYAGVTWNGTPGTRILMAWMNNWRYGRDIPATTWRGAMTLPRRLSLDPQGPWLVQEPVGAFEALRAEGRDLPTAVFDRSLDLGPVGASSETLLRLKTSVAPRVSLRWTKGQKEELRLIWDRGEGTLTLDRSRSGSVEFHPQFRDPMTIPLKTPGPVLELRVVLDVSSIEVFAEGGLTVQTALLFPSETSDWTLEVLTSGLTSIARGTTWRLVC